MKHQKRVAAIHDISGFGKCSLTVALPILSAAGIETSVIPTAVLSTHTGGFTGFTYRDLTSDIHDFYKHWHSLGISFDALYSGFLGSFEQLNIVSDIFKTFKTKDNLVVVDPVMGDHGELYKVFSPDFAKGMAELSKQADILIPNITEASLILGIGYKEGPYSKNEIEKILIDLSKLGPSKIVLTGVYFNDKELGVATYDKQTHTIGYAFAEKIPGFYHGTGDIFASALLSAILNNFDLIQAAQIAVNFTTKSIYHTFAAQTDSRFGVSFEKCIPSFLKELNLL